MDRLHTLTRTGSLSALALFSLGACEKDPAAQDHPAAKSPPSRFAAVKKRPSISDEDLEGFCDIRSSKKLSLPPLEDGEGLAKARWVNVWATWCKSCIEEIPMIETWTRELGSEVLYVSADEERSALQEFLENHSSFPKTSILLEPEKISGWMKEIGLDAGAGLPLHLFVDREGKLSCARAGAVQSHHRPLVAQLLR